MRGSGGVRRRSQLAALTALAALALTICAAVPIAASAAPPRPTAATQTATGSISGSVTADPPSSSFSALVHAINTTTGVTYGPIQTAPNGNYTLVGLPAGTYDVEFMSTNYVAQWYSSSGPGGVAAQADATPVAVTAGQTTPDINASLTGLPGSISGVVTDAATDQPLAGVTVQAFSSQQEGNCCTGLTGTATTAADGSYTISGLPTATSGFIPPYVVKFSKAGYLNQFWNHIPETSFSFTDVTPLPGQTAAGINAALQTGGGTITGTVTNTSGQPVANVLVEYLSSNVCQEGIPFCFTYTDSNGHYTVSGLVTNGGFPWSIQFDPLDTYAFQSAGPFTLADGQVLTVDAQLQSQQPGAISGSVTDDIGFPLPGASVTATSTTNSTTYGPVQTDTNGNYTLANLPVGNYNVSFSAPGYASAPYTNPVRVNAAQTTTQINGVLQPQPGSVSGTVTGPTGATIAGLTVRLFGVNPAASPPYSFLEQTTTTAADGTYTFTNVPPDSYPLLGEPVYEVQFVPPSGSGLASQWWNNKPGGDNPSGGGDPITVDAGQTVSGINAGLHSSYLYGQVTSPGGPVQGATVAVFNYFGSPVTQASTDANGNFAVADLPPGVYRAEFVPPSGSNLMTQWWNNAPDAAHSTTIGISAGKNVQIGAALTAGGSISGTVTDARGPVGGAAVGVFTVNSSNAPGTELVHTTTATDGSYNVSGLQAGSYFVLFDPPLGSSDVGQWYNNSPAAGGATEVTLSSGNSATANAQLTSGQRGSISGTVTDQSGSPIAGAAVWAVAADGALTSATSAADGTYTIVNLDVGIDTVWFLPPAGSNYQASVWNAAVGKLLPIIVDQGSTITGINATLTQNGT